MTERLNILELFAGVGGFRIGLENANPEFFHTKWANQWEPSKKAQDAYNCYNAHFPDSNNLNEDISTISNEQFLQMDADLIVGGFPCQDYSVARTLSGEAGIQGKKGVLFWEIIRATEVIRPQYLLLENVDRLLKSPSKQRGRDFAIMLSAFDNLGYSVQWRVINAADYGMAQRRRRIFIFVYRNDSDVSKRFANYSDEELIYSEGIFGKSFPVENVPYKNRFAENIISKDTVHVSENFTGNIYNSGSMRNGKYITIDTIPINEPAITLGQIILPENEIDEKYYLSEIAINKFKYLRGAKKIERTTADGHTYFFSEGGMSETDALDKPGRTMLTSEASTNRSTHLLKVNNRYRFLTPVECERLNGFPDNWTNSMSDRMRYFCMGNALVTGVIERIGVQLHEFITMDIKNPKAPLYERINKLQNLEDRNAKINVMQPPLF